MPLFFWPNQKATLRKLSSGLVEIEMDMLMACRSQLHYAVEFVWGSKWDPDTDLGLKGV